MNLDDVSLHLDNNEDELFGCPQGTTIKCQFEDGELDSLLMEKNFFEVTDSNAPPPPPLDNTIEVYNNVIAFFFFSFSLFFKTLRYMK